MIDVETETSVKFTLTGPNRFEWTPELYKHTFVVEKIELNTDGDGQRVYLHGPWVTTPRCLRGKGHLAVTGWDHLSLNSGDHRDRLTELPDAILIALGARGLKTDLLPL